MDTKTLHERLQNFLLKNRSLDIFSENVHRYIGVTFDEYVTAFAEELEAKSTEYAWIGEWAIIMEAFQWSETPQGTDYWDRLNIDWQKLCGNN